MKKYIEIEPYDWKKLQDGGILDKEDIGLADDWVEAVNVDTGYTKYGRYMFSESMNKLRMPTLLEFYGDGIVD